MKTWKELNECSSQEDATFSLAVQLAYEDVRGLYRDIEQFYDTLAKLAATRVGG